MLLRGGMVRLWTIHLGGCLPSAEQQKKREKEKRGGDRFTQFGKTAANTNSIGQVSRLVVSRR